MQLPDEPPFDLGTKKEPMKPQRSIELLADGICLFEVVADVHDELASPRYLYHADEITKLLSDLRRIGAGTAIACPARDRRREGGPRSPEQRRLGSEELGRRRVCTA